MEFAELLLFGPSLVPLQNIGLRGRMSPVTPINPHIPAGQRRGSPSGSPPPHEPPSNAGPSSGGTPRSDHLQAIATPLRAGVGVCQRLLTTLGLDSVSRSPWGNQKDGGLDTLEQGGWPKPDSFENQQYCRLMGSQLCKISIIGIW